VVLVVRTVLLVVLYIISPGMCLLTPGVVEKFANCCNLSNGEAACVQVIQIMEGYSRGRTKKCTVTISDGIHCMDVMLSPHLIELVSKGSVTLFTIISISNASVMKTATSVGCIVLQMEIKRNTSDVIGEPIYLKKRKDILSSSMGESMEKKVRLHDAKNDFLDNLHTVLISAIGKTLNTSTTTTTLMCEHCNNSPCDWTEHGPGILQYLSDEYVGRFIDDDGQIYEEFAEGRNVVTNKNIRCVAYSIFTALKHGVVGRKKRIKLPHCVECGIRTNYPDDNNNYVGFKN
jgi:hypothetical protein